MNDDKEGCHIKESMDALSRERTDKSEGKMERKDTLNRAEEVIRNVACVDTESSEYYRYIVDREKAQLFSKF